MIPDRDRIPEYVAKGSDFIRRELKVAPEHVQAKSLAQSAANILETDGSTGDATGRRVLMLSPRDWAYHTSIEGVLATALKLRGAEVAFISCGGGLDICDRANITKAPPMPCRTCTKYVDTGIDSLGFHRYPLRPHWEDEDDGTWPELDELSASELERVEHDGLPLGRLMQIPSKWFLLASRSDWDPLSPQMTRKFLITARRVALALRAIIDEFKPDTVVMLSGLFSFEAVALELCSQLGIEAVTYERTYRQNNVILSRNAAASHFDVDDLWAQFKDQPLTDAESDQLDAYLETRRTMSHPFYDFWKGSVGFQDDSDAASQRPGRTVGLFTNVTWDSAVIGRERAFDSIHDWIDASIEVFRHRQNDRLLIRVHPAEAKMTGKKTREPVMEYLRVRHPDLPDNVRVIGPEDPTNSYPLMEACDVGLVLTSIVGLELSLIGKPVVVAGRPHYSERGFTQDASSPAEYSRLLADVLARPTDHLPEPELARRYAYLFFFRAVAGFSLVTEPVPGLARLESTNARDLLPGADLHLDRVVETILTGDPVLADSAPSLERASRFDVPAEPVAGDRQ